MSSWLTENTAHLRGPRRGWRRDGRGRGGGDAGHVASVDARQPVLTARGQLAGAGELPAEDAAVEVAQRRRALGESGADRPHGRTALVTDTATLAALAFHGRSLDAAEREGRAVIDGDRPAVVQFLTRFGLDTTPLPAAE